MLVFLLRFLAAYFYLTKSIVKGRGRRIKARLGRLEHFFCLSLGSATENALFVNLEV